MTYQSSFETTNISPNRSFLTSTEVSDCSFLSCSSFSSSFDSSSINTSINLESSIITETNSMETAKMYEPESIFTSIAMGSTPPRKKDYLKLPRHPAVLSRSFSDSTTTFKNQDEKEITSCPKTPPRRSKSTGDRNNNSLLVTPNHRSSTAVTTTKRRNNRLPSPSINNRHRSRGYTTDVRFIPKRSSMRFDICRASILSAEKRRRKQIHDDLHNTDRSENFPNNSSSPNNNRNRNNTNSNIEVMSPLQTEYRRRMRGALLDVSLHESTSSAISDVTNNNNDSFLSSTSNSTNNNDTATNSTSSFLDAIFGNDMSFDTSMNLDNELPILNTSSSSASSSAYRALPDANPNDANDTIGPGSIGRFFTYEKENHDNNKQNPNTTRSIYDPYTHDQLHVFDRTANKNSTTKYYPSQDDSSSTIYKNLTKKIVTRKIPTQPSRILDAPELVDDYYLNLVSWGNSNILAVALGQCVYLWHAKSGEIDHLLTLEEEDDYVTSVTWCNNVGNEKFLAVGTNKSVVQIWDTVALKTVRTLTGHSARVGSLSWTHNNLTSGSRDSLILQHDLRTSRGVTCTYTGHLQEVCGLKWNDDGTTLASGGNENYLCIWDAAMSGGRNRNNSNSSTSSPRLLLTQHNAAVKALAWCPFHKGLLASGGGTADRTIKFWNSNSGALLNSIDTGSQVCSLLWSKYNKEICSSHGFSENQLILWRYPTMTKIQEFTGHTARVLHMEQSPDGSCVVSAAADETLRFWDIFGAPPGSDKKNKFGAKNLFNGSSSGLSSQYGMPTIR